MHRNVLFPQYEFDERLKINRETNKPPSTLYMEIGYNHEIPKSGKEGVKHYRRFYNDELENNKDIFKKDPFLSVNIVRG